MIGISPDELIDDDLIDELLSHEDRLLHKNDAAFHESYIPKRILYRKIQNREIIDAMLHKQNIYITGDISTGKTCLIRKIFSRAREINIEKVKEAKKAGKTYPGRLYIYHNCADTTFLRIFQTVAKELGFKINKSKCIADYIEDFKKYMSKDNIQTIWLCLDEIDLLIAKYREPELLYKFVNNDIFKIIAIANTDDFTLELMAREKDRANPPFINFPAYASFEIFGILQERSKEALIDNIISTNEIDILVECVFEHSQTIREGLKILSRIYDYKVLNEIEGDLSSEVISKFVNATKHISKIERIENLPTNLKACIYIIVEILFNSKFKNGITIDDVVNAWSRYAKKSKELKDLGYYSIRDYMNRLETIGLLKKMRGKNDNKTGYSFFYHPVNFDIDEIYYFITSKPDYEKMERADKAISEYIDEIRNMEIAE